MPKEQLTSHVNMTCKMTVIFDIFSLITDAEF